MMGSDGSMISHSYDAFLSSDAGDSMAGNRLGIIIFYCVGHWRHATVMIAIFELSPDERRAS